MKERLEQFLLSRSGAPPTSARTHSRLDLPEKYVRPRPLRDLYFDCGRALMDNERPAEAVAAFKQALQEKDSPLETWKLQAFLAAACEQNEDPQLAFYAYLEAVLSAPQQAELLLPFAHDLLTRRRVTAGKDWLLQNWFPAVSESNQQWRSQRACVDKFTGRVSLHLGRYDEALSYFERARELAPADVHALEGLGQSLWRTGTLARAEEILSKAYTLSQQKNRQRQVAIKAKLAQVLAAQGKYERALALIAEEDAAGEQRFVYEIRITRGQCYLALDKPNKALQAADQAALARSGTGEPYLLRSQAYIAQKEFTEAIKATDEALQQEPSNPDVLFFQAQALIEGLGNNGQVEGQGDIEQARRLLQGYAEDVGDEGISQQIRSAGFVARTGNPSLRYFLAQLFYALKQYAKAEEELERASALLEESKSELLLAATQQLKGELLEEKARGELPEAERNALREEAAECFYRAGDGYYFHDSYKLAVGSFQRAAELRPQHVLTYIHWSDALRLLAETATPQEKEEQLRRSLEVWEKGNDLGLSPADRLVAYKTCAYILSPLAQAIAAQREGEAEEIRQRREEARETWWKCACYLERVLLLDANDEVSLSVLGYCYLALNQDAAAVQALQQIRENPDALPTLALVLLVREDESALAVTERYREQKGKLDALCTFVQAFYFFFRGDLPESIRALDKAIEEEPDTLTYPYIRGRVRRLLGKSEEAQADFNSIWKITAPGEKFGDADHLLDRGNAAYELGYFSEARDIFEERLKSTTDPLGVRGSIGLCYLMLNRAEEADRWFKETLLHTSEEEPGVKGLALRMCLQDLAEMRERLPEAARTPAAVRAMEKYEEDLRKALQALQVRIQDKDAAERELRQAADCEADSVARLTALAGAARVALAEVRREVAASMYQVLLDQDAKQASPCFPEARLGLASALTYLGLVEIAQDKPIQALDYLQKSVTLRLQAEQPDPFDDLLQICLPTIDTPQEYHSLSECLRELADDPSLSGEQRSNAVKARLRLSREKYREIRPLDEKFEISQLEPQALVIELGLGLIDEDRINKQLIGVDIPALRIRQLEEIGTILQGIQIRDNLSLASNDYRLLLRDTPPVTGSAMSDRKFFPDAARCLAMRIQGTPAVDPANDKEGMWLRQADWQRAEASGLPLWDSYQYILRHLEALIRLHPEQLLSVQEVDTMLYPERLKQDNTFREVSRILLNNWTRKGESGRRAFIKEALPDNASLIRLTQVLHELLKERIPVRKIEDILTAFAEKNSKEREIGEIVEHVRKALRSELPGNSSLSASQAPHAADDTAWTLVGLSKDFEEAVARWICEREGKRFLALPFAEAQYMLNIFHEFFADRDTNKIILLVRKPGLRPFVRKLIARDFPQPVVLAEDELLVSVSPGEQIKYTDEAAQNEGGKRGE